MLKDTYYIEPTDVDQLVFDQLVPPDHYLRRVKEHIDFDSFRELVNDCYSPTMGRGAEDPVRLIKLEFLQFHYNLSDREVMVEAQVNVAFRLFLDLSLASRLPVASLLSQFRTRLGVERHRVLFDHVVGQAREHGLVGKRLRLKDATHVIANIAVPSTLGLVAQVRRRLLESARPYGPEYVAQEEAEAERLRQVTSDLKDVERLAHRVAHLRTIVSWGDAVQQALGPLECEPEAARGRFEAALALAHQVLADRDEPQRGDQVRSAIDADARRSKHGEYFDGYLLDILVDPESEIVTALDVLPGNGDEARNAAVLLEAEVQGQGETAPALSIDGIGWNGEVLRDLSDPQGLAMEVYVPPSPQVNNEGRLGPEAFSLDADRQVLSCPAGEQTSRKERNTHHTGWKFIFARSLCAACPLQAECVPTLPKGKGRSVIKNDYQSEYNAARQRATTEDYAEVRRQHPRVERKLADIVRYHGGRRSRYRGRGRVQVQYLLSGMVVNIKRMMKLLGRQIPECAPQAV